MGMLARASVSSAVATAVDGVAYQAIFSLEVGSYGTAALLGALLGGVTNFSINRWWAFANLPTNRSKSVGIQAIEYACTCLLTFFVLRVGLQLLVEGAGLSPHVAWIPAKVVAWLAVSYPIQRLIVFSSKAHVAPMDEDVSERPSLAAIR